MKIEFEAKILDISVSEIQKRLEKLGAKKLAEHNMKRYTFDVHPGDESTWLRLRDNGQEKELTIKEIRHDGIDGTDEIEITVDDIQKTKIILEKLGHHPRNYQENRRISYELEGVKLEIDFWPGIPPYLEVEALSKELVEKTLHKLGFTPEQSTSKNTADIYQDYGINILEKKELKF